MLTSVTFCLAIMQILEAAKRMQRIVPQYAPPSPSMSGMSVITVQNKDTVSSVSILSRNKYAVPGALPSKVGGGKLVCKIVIIFAVIIFN